MRMTRYAKVVQRKGHGCKRQTKDDAGKGTLKERTHEKSLWKDPEGNSGMRRRDVKELLHLRKGKKVANSIRGQSRTQHPRLKSIGKVSEIYRKTIGLEVVRATKMSTGLLKIWNWTLWKGRPPPKWKKKLLASLA
jgi:hypothetical protein